MSVSRSDRGRTQVLFNQKSAVNSEDTPQQKCVAENLHLEGDFDRLNSSEKEEVDTACHTLSLLLRYLDPNVVIGQYLDHLKIALRHPLANVKKMSIAELSRATCVDEIISQLSQDDILVNVVSCLNNDDTALAKSASALLVKLGKSPAALTMIFSGTVIKALRLVQTKGDIIRFRVLEMVVLTAAHSPECLQICMTSGFLKSLVAELETEDVVMQLNALELLTALARRPHGLKWLQQYGVLDLLADKMVIIEEPSMIYLLLPSLLKLFGIVAQYDSKYFFEKHVTVVSVLLETFDTSDVNLLGISIDTLGYIAKSVEGKYMLYNAGEKMKMAIQKIAFAIKSFPAPSRARALKAMADIIELKQVEQEAEVLHITQEFFHWLSEDPMSLVMEVFRKSFPKLRLAGLHMLKVLAEQRWGQELMKKQSDIITFLLNRDMESQNYCKNGKFAVVKAIVESPTALSVFESSTITCLKKSLKNGLSRVQTQN